MDEVIIGILSGFISGYGVYYTTSYLPMKTLKNRKRCLLRDYLKNFTRSIGWAYSSAYLALKVFSGKYEEGAFSKKNLSALLRRRFKLLETAVDVLRISYSEFQICYATVEEFIDDKTKQKIKNLSLGCLYDDIISRWIDLVTYKETNGKLEFSRESMDIEYNLHDSIADFMERLYILEQMMYPEPHNTASYWQRIERIEIK